MKRFVSFPALLALALLAAAAPPAKAEAPGRLGAGIHYLRSLDEIKDSDEFDENSVGFLGAYQLGLGSLKADLMLEWIPDYLGLDKSMILPQAYLLFGQLFYGGIGLGTGYYDGDWLDDPFYALRGGAALGLGGLGVDVFASYRFMKWEALEGLGSEDWNSLTFGVLVRFGG